MEQLRGELDEIKEQMTFFMLDMQDLVSGQELLREENHQLKTQLSLVMEILNIVLRKADMHPFPQEEFLFLPILWGILQVLNQGMYLLFHFVFRSILVQNQFMLLI